MVTIIVPASDASAIRDEIKRLTARIRSLNESIVFYEKQLNGAPAQLLYTEDEIQANPALEEEQTELVPRIFGAIDRDKSYERLLFDQTQPIVDAYEDERRALDGKEPTYVLDETLIQTSGKDRTPPLYLPPDLVNIDQTELFGGTGSSSPNEDVELTAELAFITTLLTGTCQVASPPVMPCQDAHTGLIASLLARFDPSGPSGFLVVQETALNSNPDLGSFVSLPLAAVTAEKARVDAFRVALAAIPVGDQVPSALLTPETAKATARKTFITGTRIPEMDGFLNTSPGYYNTRLSVLQLRLENPGTVHEITFYNDAIVNAQTEITALEAQIETLSALLP